VRAYKNFEINPHENYAGHQIDIQALSYPRDLWCSEMIQVSYLLIPSTHIRLGPSRKLVP
jgi:hypothetical protein